jgi:hypothetical protein
MEHLHHTLSKRGIGFLTQILNDDVVVNAKVDQAAFVIRKRGMSITFHGKDGNGDIDIIKRAGMDTYEDAINYINSQSLDQLPDDVDIFLELFSNKWKTAVQYDDVPINNMIVSYVKHNGIVVLPNDSLVLTIANTINVSPPPVLFDGKLSNEQKALILKFVQSDDDERKLLFGQHHFMEFIKTLFDIPSNLSWMHKNGYEGVVLYFQANNCSMKIVDPAFTLDKQDHHQCVDHFKNALTSIIYDNLESDVASALVEFNTSRETKPKDLLYIDFISFLTSTITRARYNQLRELEQYERVQKSKRYSNITFDLVPQYMRPLVEKYWWVEEVFTLLINTLRKDKKAINTRQGITVEHKHTINKTVALLRQGGLV